jgi:hypothetical protein
MLTTEESQKLSKHYEGFDLQEETCPVCEQEQTLGIG